MGSVQKTALEAFERDLDEAEKNFVAAGSAVAEAQRKLNERRVEEGLEPLDFFAEPEESADEDDSEEEDQPEETRGFGIRRKGRR